MKAYDQIDFFSQVSKVTNKSLLLVSVDPDLLDENGRAFEKHFVMLAPEALDEIRISGTAIIEFDSEEQARRVHHMMDFAHRQIGDIGLYAVFFVNGETILGISQERCPVEVSTEGFSARLFG